MYRKMGKTWDAQSGEGGDENPYRLPEVMDSPLTEIGRSQARALQPRTRALAPELVVVSPLTRTAQTAMLAFAHLLPTGGGGSGGGGGNGGAAAAFVAHEACHEIAGVHTCDRRRSLTELRREFPFIDYDQAGLKEEDPFWSETEREPLPRLADRGYELLMWLRDRSEKDVAVVSHFGWLFTLLNAVLVLESPELAAGFMTGELRSLILRFE
eukprot:SRR837773.1736.p1 GENE.SRR837773.1736~~SRR837773.1736.p1  ORF type:complete len:234 (+),score=84.44 SRR837773.1736:67-702(+)